MACLTLLLSLCSPLCQTFQIDKPLPVTDVAKENKSLVRDLSKVWEAAGGFYPVVPDVIATTPEIRPFRETATPSVDIVGAGDAIHVATPTARPQHDSRG